MLYNEKLRVSETDLDKLSIHSAKLNEADIDLYGWITDDGINNAVGLAWLGSACTSGDATCTPGNPYNECWAKTSVTQGPSRQQAIIETAEVSCFCFLILIAPWYFILPITFLLFIFIAHRRWLMR